MIGLPSSSSSTRKPMRLYSAWRYLGCICIELSRYINIFYSILIKVMSEAYNERVNETPH